MIKIEYMKIKFVSICYIVLNAGDYEYDNFRNTVNEWSQKMLKQNDEAKTLLKFTTTSIQDLTRRHLQKMFCQKEWLLKQENTCFNTSHIHPHITFIYYFPQGPLA